MSVSIVCRVDSLSASVVIQSQLVSLRGYPKTQVSNTAMIFEGLIATYQAWVVSVLIHDSVPHEMQRAHAVF